MAHGNIVPTQKEMVMREDDFLVSKTDLKGRITYGNRIFIEFSGYSEAELLGSQHNIVRHPGMPRGIFRFLWDTIGQKKECFAYVKNMSKAGGFYWVFANVTPSINPQGEVEGYFSVRPIRHRGRGVAGATPDRHQTAGAFVQDRARNLRVKYLG